MQDRDVLPWLARERTMEEKDNRLESLLTVRRELKQAGLHQVGEERKIRGKLYFAFANPAALEKGNTWDELKDYCRPDIDKLLDGIAPM